MYIKSLQHLIIYHIEVVYGLNVDVRFICLYFSVINGQMTYPLMGQMGQVGQRRNFPRRQMGGGVMGTGTSVNGQVVSMNNAPIDTPAGGTTGQGTGMNAQPQGQGQTNAMPAQGMSNNQNGGGGAAMGYNTGGGGGMGHSGFSNGMLGGGIDPSAFMGGGNSWMRMSMAMNSELPPMMMGRNFNARNMMQYRSCEKTPSSFNYICNPQAPNQCQAGPMLSASMPMMGGMPGMGGMGGAGRQRNILVCSRMTEHGIARCCARNIQIARYLGNRI